MPRKSGAGGSRKGVAVLLWAAAGLISGVTMRRYLEPFDEGLLMQGASRILDGQWPYADFGWPYGPGQPAAVAGLSWLFEPSVAWWRGLRVAADATTAVAVWALVRPVAGDRWALAAWLAAAVTVAQPTSANPFPVALAFALCAVLAGARGRPVPAGLLAAAAAFWRPDIGAVAAAAAAIALLVRGRATARGGAGPRGASAASGGATPRELVRPALVALLTALLAAVALYAPFAAEAGVGRLWDELVGIAAGDGDLWRLPFPLGYEGPLRGWPPDALAEDLKDVLGFYLPLAGVAIGVLVLVSFVRRRPGPELAGVTALAFGCALYLFSRPDDLHAQPLVVCLCAAVPLAIAAEPRAEREAGGRAAPRALGVALAAGLALIVLAGAANRLSALLLPPDLEPVRLAGVPGIRVPPAEAEAIPRMVARVRRLVPPGEPIYVAPRRSDLVTISDPLIHFLVRRPNVVNRDVSVQALPEEQARTVAALRRTRPKAIVRWTDPASARPEPNRRGRPSGTRALDEYLAAEYRLDARFGAYDVLVPRRG
jgi:hypothetical protein